VSLTTGRGPLSARPAGRFNTAMPEHIVYAEPFRRRIRATVGGQTVIDSERVVLVHRRGVPPSFAFPPEDVTGLATKPEPDVAGYVAVPWDAVDAWLEEDEVIFGHPRNPYHRIDCLRTHRRLRAEIDGVRLVDTEETVALYETALEPRLYVDRRHVRIDLLTPSQTQTYCPYKGTATYWSARVNGRVHADVTWCYEDPLPESSIIRGLLSFDDQRVDLTHNLPPA